MHNKIYIVLIATVFAAFTFVFDTMPRSRYSELEKRELAGFPEFSWEKLFSGDFTKGINSWFSDSEPFRDVFMMCSMEEKNLLKLHIGNDAEQVTFHASADGSDSGESDEMDLEMAERNVGKFHNAATADENAKIANRGIIIVGSGNKTRALMAYGGSSKGGVKYAESANLYKEVFGAGVNVYCMVIPTAVDFYCPDKARKCSNEEQPTINNIYAHLSKDVHAVDVYSALARHVNEDIFLRTDHHWAPLGAYYAAQQFAKVAKVPFKSLASYERHVVHDYVGSMYGYSKDIELKKNPEDFVYYVPKGVTYTTYYTDYTINSNYEVTGEGKPYKGKFFYKYKDGNGGAYCTFMGSDTRITRVVTSTKNHRRVLILKDSFGNAIPGYLFYSFEEVHVVDYRYFKKNMKDYVRDNKITDILFANNIFNCYSSKISSKYTKFLSQTGGGFAPKTTAAPKKEGSPKDDAPAATHDKTTKSAATDSIS
jgi:hypothetical protein